MGNFHNLDNEEVIFIYLSNQKFITQYDKLFELGGIESVVDISETTLISTFKEFSDQDLLDILENNHYKYCIRVNDKLTPIIELIRESIPGLYEQVESSFQKEE